MASGAQIAIGDLDMVHNKKQPRGFWKTKVENLIIGKNQKIRGATLRVPSGNGKLTVLH